MELRAYLRLLADRMVVLVASAILAGVAAYYVSPHKPIYTGRATLYVGDQRIDESPGSRDLSYDRAAALDRLTHTYAVMIDSRPIASAAIARVALDRSPASLVAATSTSQVEGTQLLYVDVHDPDPATAQKLANALADSFVEAIKEFSGQTREGAVPTLPAYVFERASLPTAPDPSNLPTNVAIAAILGLGLAIAGVLLADHLDVTIRSVSEAERRLRLPVLGVVPFYPDDVVARVDRAWGAEAGSTSAGASQVGSAAAGGLNQRRRANTPRNRS